VTRNQPERLRLNIAGICTRGERPRHDAHPERCAEEVMAARRTPPVRCDGRLARGEDGMNGKPSPRKLAREHGLSDAEYGRSRDPRAHPSLTELGIFSVM